jgi:hypothetical protein
VAEKQLLQHDGVIMRLVVYGEDQRDPAMQGKPTQPIKFIRMLPDFRLAAAPEFVAIVQGRGRTTFAVPYGSLLFPNSVLILQSVAFSLIAIGALEELDALAKDLIPELRRLHMHLTAETFLVASAEAALRLGRVREARAMLPTREAIQSAALQQGGGRGPFLSLISTSWAAPGGRAIRVQAQAAARPHYRKWQ